MKILIADDHGVNRRILSAMLVAEGHTVIEAADGAAAMTLFEREQPDMVLLDVIMPYQNGYEVARHIKAQSSERFTPVIFLTALTDEAALQQGIESGGDDFLTKPYNQVVLRSRIIAMERIRVSQQLVERQRNELRHNQAKIEEEMTLGAHILAIITQRANLDLAGLRFWSAPLSRFNGDLLLAAPKPTGGLYVMLGDFTGHGLSAAVGAIPAAEVFYGMTAKNFIVADILGELNDKLRGFLPVGYFCAAAIVELDVNQNTLSIWNGGLPDILVINADERLSRRIVSAHLPLGIIAQDRAAWQPEVLALDEVAQLYLFSDGVTEAANISGELYGQERMERNFIMTHPAGRFDAVIQCLETFCQGAPQQDDISLIELDCRKARAVTLPIPAYTLPQIKGDSAVEWQVELLFSAETLRSVDPVPILVQMLGRFNLPESHIGHISTVLAELCSNALDHGLLGLESGMKSNAAGFTHYYTLRAERLRTLTAGQLRVALAYSTAGALRICIQDSGAGFDYRRLIHKLEQMNDYSGRGIALVRSLCTQLIYSGNGNVVEALYHWNHSDRPASDRVLSRQQQAI